MYRKTGKAGEWRNMVPEEKIPGHVTSAENYERKAIVCEVAKFCAQDPWMKDMWELKKRKLEKKAIEVELGF